MAHRLLFSAFDAQLREPKVTGRRRVGRTSPFVPEKLRGRSVTSHWRLERTSRGLDQVVSRRRVERTLGSSPSTTQGAACHRTTTKACQSAGLCLSPSLEVLLSRARRRLLQHPLEPLDLGTQRGEIGVHPVERPNHVGLEPERPLDRDRGVRSDRGID